VPGSSFNDTLRKTPPHLVLDPTDDMTILREEIFGPLLPVKTYRDLDEVIAYVNARDRPLGFYIFTNDAAREEKLLYGTISGGVTINNCMLHVAQHDLPFGGVGSSGIGQYHGWEGFTEFSKMRPVFKTPRLSLRHFFYSPYKPEPVLPGQVDRKISPLGKVPGWNHERGPLSDSSIICAYLERTRPEPALYPRDPYEYARALWFEEYGDSALLQVFGPKIFFKKIIGPRFMGQQFDPAEIQKAWDEEAPPLLEYLESQLAGDWLVGQSFSIGD